MTGPRVVIGTGVVGAAVADELTARGWTDDTVLVQRRIAQTVQVTFRQVTAVGPTVAR